MKYLLNFVDLVSLDLIEIKAWYHPKGVYQNFTKTLNLKFNEILKNPYKYAIRFNKIRYCSMANFPYHIAFVVKNEKIIILSIFHQKRKDDFIVKRL